MRLEYEFMSVLPKYWWDISKCARREPYEGKTHEAQPEDRKRTKNGVKDLLECSRWAKDSLLIQTWEYQGSGRGGGGYGRGCPFNRTRGKGWS
ncbi:hypothetical protein Tco_0338784, partial [Tanacetum coccineum]